MQHDKSRSEKRRERYAYLKAKGETSAPDILYKSEIKKLTKEGYDVDNIGPHPALRNLWLCKVVFPKE